ncbi:hypothetical protein [Streptomyces hebeiensis]
MSVDPGQNVGVATFRKDGSDINKTIMNLNNFQNWLAILYKTVNESHSDRILNFIVEDYTLRKDKALDQTGSNMPASKCIGSIEQIQALLETRCTIFYAKPTNLKTALKWAGYHELANKPRTYHVSDDISAYAHGVHRLIDLGLRTHPIFNED